MTLFAVILAADMWMCDPHGLCSMQHDYVGIGDKPWPVPRHYPGWWGREKPKMSHKHKTCKLGDPGWEHDCTR